MSLLIFVNADGSYDVHQVWYHESDGKMKGKFCICAAPAHFTLSKLLKKRRLWVLWCDLSLPGVEVVKDSSSCCGEIIFYAGLFTSQITSFILEKESD